MARDHPQAWAQPQSPPPLPRPSSLPPPLPSREKANLFTSQFLNPAELARFENLMIFARTVVEGWFAGRHKSPHFGFSAEFIEHKPYAHGDDIEHIDWKVYARTKKLHVRKYLEETDMTVHLLVDASPSMDYTVPNRERKYSRVARIAAALAYLMIRQGDKAAMGLFADGLLSHTPAGGTRRHIHRLLQRLEKPALTASMRRTDIPRALEQVAAQLRRRARIVILSDFLGTDLDAMFDGLGQFLHRGFEVMLLQVLDPDELDLPALNVARFRDMETDQEVQVEPEEIRAAYQREIAAHTEKLRTQALRRRITFESVNTQAPYLDAIEAYMGFRRK
ncbi:MAG: DUF58 domain-containing protein [Verrucomicrobiaceae bacterium]|nr:DUF58 domain-containing protein [Verrucomicrobiaceae bacterium]